MNAKAMQRLPMDASVLSEVHKAMGAKRAGEWRSDEFVQ